MEDWLAKQHDPWTKRSTAALVPPRSVRAPASHVSSLGPGPGVPLSTHTLQGSQVSVHGEDTSAPRTFVKGVYVLRDQGELTAQRSLEAHERSMCRIRHRGERRFTPRCEMLHDSIGILSKGIRVQEVLDLAV